MVKKYGDGVLDTEALATLKQPAFLRYLEWAGKAGKSLDGMARCLGLSKSEAVGVFAIFKERGLVLQEAVGYNAPYRLYAPQYAPSNRRKIKAHGSGTPVASRVDLSLIDANFAKRGEEAALRKSVRGQKAGGRKWGCPA
jgi:hypothetical protein